MKTSTVAMAVLACVLQALSQTSATADQSLAGEWQLTTTILSIKSASRVTLTQSGNQLHGSVYNEGDNIPVNGTLEGSSISFAFKTGDLQNTYAGVVSAGGISGTLTMTGKEGSVTGTWTAKRAAQDKPAAPRNLEFEPTEFHRALSADVPPVLRIWPGDVVHTKSVDAGGQDEKSVYRVAGGNPLTGPFYVEGAMPGDVVAITIKRLRLNRDWAMSASGFVDRALTADFSAANKQNWATTRWHLDADKQVGTLENAPAQLNRFSVKLHPMLGCLGVAPGPGDAPLSTLDSADIGGNMDFNGVAEGATVFLPVRQPGALIYLGDAHAVQGDGELNGDALETSMNIEFTAGVLREKSIGTPRLENKDYIMAIGLSGSLDDAFRKATAELANWLQSDYKLSASEAAIVMGSSVEYTLSEVADRNVGLVAKIRKSALASVAGTK